MIARPLPDAVDPRQLDRIALLGRARERDGVETGARDEAGDRMVRVSMLGGGTARARDGAVELGEDLVELGLRVDDVLGQVEF
jgi:hypothetical protein